MQLYVFQAEHGVCNWVTLISVFLYCIQSTSQYHESNSVGVKLLFVYQLDFPIFHDVSNDTCYGNSHYLWIGRKAHFIG